MDSLLLLCARRIVAQRPLPAIPADLYPVLFQAAFLDGKPLVLQHLVATWPFPVLNFQQLLGHLELCWDDPYIDCVEAVMRAMVTQLQQELVEPRHQSRLVLGIPAWPLPPILPSILMFSSYFFQWVLAACSGHDGSSE